jgi:hypothetical protein
MGEGAYGGRVMFVSIVGIMEWECEIRKVTQKLKIFIIECLMRIFLSFAKRFKPHDSSHDQIQQNKKKEKTETKRVLKLTLQPGPKHPPRAGLWE